MRNFKAYFSVLVAVTILAVNIMTASAAAFAKPYKENNKPQQDIKHNKKGIIVKYKPNKKSREEEIKKNLKKSLKNKTLKHNKKLSGYDYEVMEFYDDEDLDSIVESLEKDPDIEFVQPDYELELLDEMDYSSVQAAVYRSGEITGIGINVQKAWEITKGSKEVIVGILDNDVDIFHKDLSKNVFTNPGEIPANGLDDDNNGYIDDVNGMDFANDDNTVFDSQEEEHGTAVAGIVAAAGGAGGITGIAPDVRILPIKFMNGKTGKTSDAIEAINYARKLGVRVIVCSWGSSEYSPLLKEAMEESDIVFVCAAGNDGTSQYIYPAAFGLPNIISVAAADANGNLADFSNYGDRVDLAAPGVDIYTTFPGGKYGYKSGTSIAAPHVAAAAALLLSTNGQLSAKDVAATIKGNVRVVPELQGKVTSGGILDLYSPLINPIKYNEDLYRDINPEEFMASEKIEENDQQAIIRLLNSGHNFTDVLKAYYACKNIEANVSDAVKKEDNNTEELLSMGTSFDRTELDKIVQLADKHYLSALFLLKYAVKNELTADKLEDLLEQAVSIRPLDAADNFNDLEYTKSLLKNGVSAPLNLNSVSEEIIDPATGNLEIKQTDLFLKGKNGLDFALTRFYNLNEANFGKPYMGRSYGTRYENGIPVYTGMLPSMKVDENTDKDEHYNIGTGWSFDLPYVKVKDSGYGVLYLGSAGAWSLEGTAILDTNYDKIVRYQFSDMKLEENYKYQFGDTDIKYILTFKDGKVMNFDSIGRILSIDDRFGNKISFKYTRKFNSNFVLSSIYDSVGRKISFTYAEDNSQVTVSLTDPSNPYNNRTVYYNKARVPDKKNEFILDSVVVTGNDKSQNREFKYKYSYLPSNFTYKDGDRVDGAGTDFACLTEVIHKTGASTKYEYIKRTKKMGKYGEMGYYKVSKRVDVDEKGREYNLKTYKYAYDGSGEYDGYPKYYEYYPGTKTMVADSNGNTEIYTFGKYLLCEEVLSQGPNHKNQVINQYENKLLKKKITRIYNTQTNTYVESIENYQYAKSRNLLGYWSTRAERDADGMPVNDECKTSYTYNNYSDLKSKIYKRESSSTIIEEYAPDESNGGKSIEYARVYEMMHKSPSLFNYDTDLEPLAAGGNSSFAILGDGTLIAWGENDNGQLGRQYFTNNTAENLKYVKQISVGGSHAVALMYDGSVRVWGSNEYFQLGLDGSYDWDSPVILKGLNNVKQVAAGGAFTLALMNDGSVKAWGKNDKGQLGLGDTKNRKVPTTIPGLTGVRELVAGVNFAFAIMNDGTVKAWGRNGNGELGLGDKTARLQPTVVPGLRNVKKIATGGYNAIALMNDGTVKHWGYKPKSLVPVTVQGVSNVKQVQAGSDFLLALLNDGTVKGWGSNGYYHLLGFNDMNDYNTPVQIPGLSGVKFIASGSMHTIAMLQDGSIVGWGNDDDHQICIRSKEISIIPGTAIYKINNFSLTHVHQYILRKQSQYLYDTYGNITEERNYLDNWKNYISTRFSYDDNDSSRNGQFNGAYLTRKWVENVKDADGSNSVTVDEKYQYDWFGNLKEVRDGNGNLTTYEYDYLNRVKKKTTYDSTLPQNPTVQWNYDDVNNTVETIDEKGNRKLYDYDAIGNLIYEKVFDPKTNAYHNVKQFQYDSACRIDWMLDIVNGGKHDYTYYADGRLNIKAIYDTKDNNRLLYQETYTYNDSTGEGLSMATKEVKGDLYSPSIVTKAYTNKHGVLERQERLHKEGSETKTYRDTFTYNLVNEVISEKSARATDEGWDVAYTLKYEYDFEGKIINQYNAKGENISTRYDSLGRVISVTDIMGNKASEKYSTTYAYDSLGRVITEKIPFSKGTDGTIYYTIKKYYYDKNGNIISEKITNNKPGDITRYRRIDYSYNPRNLLTMVTTYNGSTPENYTQYYYDACGNKVRMYTGLSKPLAINGLDKVTAQGDTEYSITKYDYNHLNLLSKMTDPMQKEEIYSYDLAGNLISKIDRNGNTTSFTYDGLGRQRNRKVTNQSNQVLEQYSTTYTQTGSVYTITGGGIQTTYTYDDLGRLAARSDSRGVVEKYTYDASNNRKSFKLIKGSIEHINTTYTYDRLERLEKVYENGQLAATYTYDYNGNRDTLTYTNGNSVKYTYNLANKLETLVNKTGSNTIKEYAYQYYLDGNQEGYICSTDYYSKWYTYDGLGRLETESVFSMNKAMTSKVSYAYDDYNNRAKMTVDGESSTVYMYDKNNRLTTEIKTPVTVTSTNLPEKVTYAYDSNGNTKSKITVKGPETSPVSITEVKYDYDGFNQLKKVTEGSHVYTYSYSGDGLRYQKTIDGVTTYQIWDGQQIAAEMDNYGTITNKYIRGINLIYASDAAGNKKHYLYDGHGDVVQLTNSQGQVIKKYIYDAFGNEVSPDANDTNPFRYCGEYWDKETGTYYLRARYYNPYIGRFTTEDSFWGKDADPLSLNLYTYCYNNPVYFVDPLGHEGINLGDLWNGFKKVASVTFDFIQGVGAGQLETITYGQSSEIEVYYYRDNETVYLIGKLVGNAIVGIGGTEEALGGASYIVVTEGVGIVLGGTTLVVHGGSLVVSSLGNASKNASSLISEMRSNKTS